MTLFGSYSFERLQNTLQGFFAYKYIKETDEYLLNLFMIQFRIKPNTYMDVYLVMQNNTPNKLLLHIVGT